MLFAKFSVFKQRTPREFNYKPIYYKEEEDQNPPTHEERIRSAFQKQGKSDAKSFAEKMEERRYLESLHSNHRGRSKIIYLIALAAIIALFYFML